MSACVKEDKVIMPVISGNNGPPAVPATQLPFLFALRSSDTFILITVTLGMFAHLCVYGIIVPIIPFIIRDRIGGDVRNVGILLGCYAAGLLIGSPLFGYLGDRVATTRRMPMLGGVTCLMLSTLAFALATSYWHLLIARFAQGVSGAVIWTMGFCLVTDTFPPERLGSQMGKVLATYPLGLLVGPPLGGLLYDKLGYFAPFIFCSCLAALDGVFRLLLIEKNVSSRILSPSDNSREAAVNEDGAGVQVLTRASRHQSLFRLYGHPKILAVSFIALVNAAVFAGLEPTFPLHMNDHYGLNSSQIGLVFISFIIPGFISSPVAGSLADRWGALPVSAITMLASTAFLIVLGVVIGPVWEVVVILFFAGGSLSAFVSPLVANIGRIVLEINGEHGDWTSGHGYATAYGVFNLAYSSGMLFGPVLSSFVYNAVGFTWMCVVLAGLCVAALSVACFGIRNKQHQSGDHADV